MCSECKKHCSIISSWPNLIEGNKIKISSEFENFRISRLPTAEGQKLQKLCFFAIFGPLRLATPISENFQTRWKFLFCYPQSDFGYEKIIEQCFYTRSTSTLLKRKFPIGLTCETLRPVCNP